MNIVRHSLLARLGLGVLLLAAIGSAACGLDKQSAPALIGPSEFALSLALTASPETLSQDGRSSALITAVARNERGELVPNLTIAWNATASTSRVMPVTLSASTSVTDAAGRATVTLNAPPVPSERPGTPDTITVSATPLGAVQALAEARFVTVTLRPVSGTQLRNNPPVPDISASSTAPIVGQAVTFNASLTTDEGEICLDRCTYSWNFGDARNGVGRIVQHIYIEASGTAPYTVTLTATDERGGAATTTLLLTAVPSPAVPVARFTFSPSEPVANSPVQFDASSSTASQNAVIRTYSWDFGDGVTATTSTPTIDHTFDEARNPFHVTLTVTDTNNRTSATAARDIRVRD